MKVSIRSVFVTVIGVLQCESTSLLPMMEKGG